MNNTYFFLLFKIEVTRKLRCRHSSIIFSLNNIIIIQSNVFFSNLVFSLNWSLINWTWALSNTQGRYFLKNPSPPIIPSILTSTL